MDNNKKTVIMTWNLPDQETAQEVVRMYAKGLVFAEELDELDTIDFTVECTPSEPTTVKFSAGHSMCLGKVLSFIDTCTRLITLEIDWRSIDRADKAR